MPDDKNRMIDPELDQPATRRDLLTLEEKLRRHMDDRSDELRRHMADRSDELRRHMEDRSDQLRRHMDDRSDELRRHFDVVAESFKSDFANLFDWTQSTTSTMGGRIDGLESRVTRLEPRRKN